MYSLVIYIYSLCVHVAALFSTKARTLIRGQHATWNYLKENIREGDSIVWFHAASLGEFEQGRPLIERLRQRHPEKKILLTFFSPSGYEVRKNYEGADLVCYLPFDQPINALRFVNRVKPEAAYFIKYEFWLNYLRALRHIGTPVYSVSSIFRPSQMFFKRFNFGYSYVLHLFTHFYVQNEESKTLLASIGITNVSVVGDTRFDRVLDIHRAARHLPLLEKWSLNKPQGMPAPPTILICGSTWPPDEDLIINYFNQHPELRIVVAPHVVSEDHLTQIESKLQRKSLRFSQVTAENICQADCLIVDCYGLLSAIYGHGDVAYIGGGFGVGIHNVPEAAVYGVPVIIGPKNKKFLEAQHLLANGGALQVTDQRSFDATMYRLINDPTYRRQAGQQAGNYIAHHAGAADAIANATM